MNRGATEEDAEIVDEGEHEKGKKALRREEDQDSD